MSEQNKASMQSVVVRLVAHCEHPVVAHDIDGGATCSKCGRDLGWYCHISPKHFCEYTNGDELCIHCGAPEERQQVRITLGFTEPKKKGSEMTEQNYIERYWRDATPADAIKEPPMLARFRDTVQEQWESGCLSGFDRPRSNSTERWWYSSNSAESFNFCQVYDAPDPGEGWRLIDTEKDKPQEGDEYREKWDVAWKPRNELSTTLFAPETFYRRRIEQPKPKYEPFRWEDREQLRGRWIIYKLEDGSTIETQVVHMSEHGGKGVWFKSHDPKWLLENATFLDTGEPVGRKVE